MALTILGALLSPTVKALGAEPLIPCAANDLHTRYVSGEGAAGTLIYKLKVTNSGRTPCQLGGYFDVQLFKNGERAEVDVSHRRPPDSEQYLLLPDDALFFRIETHDVEPPIHRPHKLRLRAPGTKAWFDLRIEGFVYTDGYVGVWALQDK